MPAAVTAGKATDVAALQKARPHVDPDSEATHRLKNRDAQRRFRQRQRVRVPLTAAVLVSQKLFCRHKGDNDDSSCQATAQQRMVWDLC